METFSLDICKRLAQTLGDKCPKTFTYCWAQPTHNQDWFDGGSEHRLIQCKVGELINTKATPAFSIGDLDSKAWQAIGEKLGWSQYDIEATPQGRKYGWSFHAKQCYEAWLTGGYAEADKYLDSILPK